MPEENHFQTNLYENYDQWGRNWLQLDNLNYSSPVTNMIPRNQGIHWEEKKREKRERKEREREKI